jgi:RNA polymerase sigma-70 factor (ECF subfamily)
MLTDSVQSPPQIRWAESRCHGRHPLLGGLATVRILASSLIDASPLPPNGFRVKPTDADLPNSDAGQSEPMPLADEDAPWVARAQAGDFAAFEALAMKYERRVYGLARRMLRHRQDAEEVVQQTFLSVIEHLGEFRAEARFSTWLLRIAANHALALIRRRTVRATLPLSEDHSGNTDAELPHPQFIAVWRETPAEIASRHETRRAIDDALAELDDKYRLVFVLRDMEGLSTAETAETLGITEENVKIRLMRARLMLRERLTRLFGDEATRVAPHEH